MRAVWIALVATFSLAAGAQQPQSGKPDHAAGVDSRGDAAMGFSHETTTHHFTLFPDGGRIEVVVNRTGDGAARDEIRMHLSHIVKKFKANDFDIPMFIHDRVPPGVPVMKKKRDAISYTYVETDLGGFIRIKTTDPEALKAVHDFLRFQIRDHRTGDPEAVQPGA